jgi:hypothetical protein
MEKGVSKRGQFNQTGSPLTEPFQRMNRNGQFQIGFGMIFSIIIIIAIVGVAIYVITFFLGLSKCSDVGFFYSDLGGEIDKAWKSPSYRDVYSASVPKGIEYVCFGTLNSEADGLKAEEIQEEIDFSIYSSETANVFMYPPSKACDGDLANKKLEHVQIEGFFCIENDGDIKIRLEKEIKDALVRLARA